MEILLFLGKFFLSVVSRNLFESPIVFYIFIAIGVIVIWFLLMTTLSNPGIIFRGEDNQLKESKKSVCGRYSGNNVSFSCLRS